MPGATVLLFVYGSLKRSGRHHGELAGARFLGPAETEPGYQLVELGEYLALVPRASPNGTGLSTVRGELFEMKATLLPALDAFEGDAYFRADVKVALLLSEDRAQTAPRFGKAVFALAYLKKAG